jgi:hypothetical protein
MNEDQSEFPNDDYIFNNLDLDNVVQTIENFESIIGEKNVKKIQHIYITDISY